MRTSLRPRRLRLAIAIASTFVLAGSGVTLGHAPPDDGHADSGLEIHGTGHHQHGGTGGHLPGSVSNVELIGQLTVGDAAEGKIADVAVWGDYAYLGSFFQDACFGPERVVDGGVYIVDISDPSDPIEVGFIRTQQDTYVGEGVQVISVDTPQFDGDILVINNESCTLQGKGGVSIYDVTDPLKPKMLVEHAGDRNVNFARFGKHANDIHSAFAWDAGDRAYVVLVDDLEFTDVDILDITDPRKPRLIAEY
ncbi:MAG TPA: hypothetical protein VLH10_05430, partial [Yinghuangia sp.]|nr:hypothetical protein [Yinghuangia sp.]